MKKCILILPYFGKFPNYFQLFLNSCAFNKEYNWLIFTDDKNKYNYPDNVKVVFTTLQDTKKLIEDKIGFEVCLETPYKLCDYKPAYGYIFEDYIMQFEYWGHCDCDMIFGNLKKILTPILNMNYNKIFAAGHLTVYKNDYQNNRKFMSDFNGESLFKKIFTINKICIFDEDYNSDKNVHSIFLSECKDKIYCNDLSMNVSLAKAKLTKDYYEPLQRKFIKVPYKKARYYFDNGNIYSLSLGKMDTIIKNEYIYIHLQERKMRVKCTNINLIEILSDRFINVKIIPKNKNELKIMTIGFTYLSLWDRFYKKIKRRVKKIIKL